MGVGGVEDGDSEGEQVSLRELTLSIPSMIIFITPRRYGKSSWTFLQGQCESACQRCRGSQDRIWAVRHPGEGRAQGLYSTKQYISKQACARDKHLQLFLNSTSHSINQNLPPTLWVCGGLQLRSLET